MRVICYVRVSTREQAEKGYSVGEQQERLRAYCMAKDWIVEDVITDPGFSGAKLERPGIQRVIQLVQEKKCEAVLVWKLDRLSRSQKDTLYLIEDVFLKNGCAFVSMNENFDTSTAFGRAMIGILSVFAQLEREQIRERMAVGRVGRAKAGLFHGGGFAPIGYDYKTIAEGGEGLVVNEYEAMQVREVFSLYLQGWPVNRIRKYMTARYTTKSGDWGNDTTIRDVLKNPLYIGKCTLTLAKAKRELEVPAIVSKTEFQKAQKKLESTRLPSRKKARKNPNLLFKKIYDKESGKGLLCRTSEDESRQVYSFDKGYRCFSGKAPFIESEKIFREILSALEKEKMQAAHIDRVLDLNPEKVKQCMDAGLLQYRKRANEIVARLMAKDDERTAVYREYEQGSISLEQVDEYEHQYQVAVQKQEAAFKKVMLAVNDIEKAFSHGNPWLMKFRAISIPETLERTHLKEWLDHVWIVDFEQVEVILQESKWKGFFPEEWLNNGEEDCNGKKE